MEKERSLSLYCRLSVKGEKRVMKKLMIVDDEFLVRHIYDNYCIVREKGVNVPVLKNFVQICIQLW